MGQALSTLLELTTELVIVQFSTTSYGSYASSLPSDGFYRESFLAGWTLTHLFPQPEMHTASALLVVVVVAKGKKRKTITIRE